MHIFLNCFVITLGACLMTTKLSANTDVPLQFAVQDISISLLHQSGHDISGGYQITLNGNGNSFYSRNNAAKKPISIDDKTLLEFVNDFYLGHFFELADTYTVKKHLLLKDNAMVATVATKMLDMDSKQLCIQLAAYKKCITIMNHQPLVASNLADKIEKWVMP